MLQPSCPEPAPAPARAHSPLSRRPVAPRSPASSTATSTACGAAPGCMARLGCAFGRRGPTAVEREERQRRAPQLQRRAAAASPEDRRTRRPEEAGWARSQSVAPPPSGTSLRGGQPHRLARPRQGLLQRARRQTPRPPEGSEHGRGESAPHPNWRFPRKSCVCPGRGDEEIQDWLLRNPMKTKLWLKTGPHLAPTPQKHSQFPSVLGSAVGRGKL